MDQVTQRTEINFSQFWSLGMSEIGAPGGGALVRTLRGLPTAKPTDLLCFPVDSIVRNPLANGRDTGSNPGLGRPLGGRNGYPLRYSSPENLLDRG